MLKLRIFDIPFLLTFVLFLIHSQCHHRTAHIPFPVCSCLFSAIRLSLSCVAVNPWLDCGLWHYVTQHGLFVVFAAVEWQCCWWRCGILEHADTNGQVLLQDLTFSNTELQKASSCFLCLCQDDFMQHEDNILPSINCNEMLGAELNYWQQVI